MVVALRRTSYCGLTPMIPLQSTTSWRSMDKLLTSTSSFEDWTVAIIFIRNFFLAGSVDLQVNIKCCRFSGPSLQSRHVGSTSCWLNFARLDCNACVYSHEIQRAFGIFILYQRVYPELIHFLVGHSFPFQFFGGFWRRWNASRGGFRGGGAPGAPPKIGKNIFFFCVKSWFQVHTKYPQKFSRIPPLGAIFFKCAHLTWNPGSAPVRCPLCYIFAFSQ